MRFITCLGLGLLILYGSAVVSSEDLIQSVESGDLEQVKSILELGNINIDHIDENRGTALHIAAKSGSLAIVRLLTAKNADVSLVYGKSQSSALHLAAREGHLDIVEHLIEIGADTELKDKKGETPIFAAILKNRTDVIDALIEKGASLEVISRFKDTPTYKAVALGKTEAAELLLANNAPLSIPRVVETKCAKCHGIDGRSNAPFSPNLASMGQQYLRQQFEHFQSGARNHPKKTSRLVNGISTTVLSKLVKYYSEKPPISLETDPNAMVLGKLIYETACLDCHSVDGAATKISMPRLAGQNAEYLAIQMRAYRDGSRNNDIDGVMREASSELTDNEILNLTTYLQGL